MAILAGATRSPDTPGADIFFGVLLLALGLAFVVFRRRFAEDTLFLRFLRREPTPALLTLTRISLIAGGLLAVAVGLLSIAIGISRL
jgi:hypothetical protein